MNHETGHRRASTAAGQNIVRATPSPWLIGYHVHLTGGKRREVLWDRETGPMVSRLEQYFQRLEQQQGGGQ